MEFGYVGLYGVIIMRKRNNKHFEYILAFLFMLVIIVF